MGEIIPFPQRQARPEPVGNPFLGVAWNAALWLIIAAVMVAWGMR